MFKLKKLKKEDTQIIELFYQWKLEEENLEHYSCRPVKAIGSLEDHMKTYENLLSKTITYYLEKEGEILARLVVFDFNTRNKSAEFGYYMPKHNRGKSYGTKMMSLFLQDIFETTDLNKIYATTSSINEASKIVLVKHGFQLDGVMREHYFINDTYYDQLCYSLLRREL